MIKKNYFSICFMGGILLSSLFCQGKEPVNLALSAQVEADSEYSPLLAARFVNDGRIPAPLCQQDNGCAWAVNGKTHPNHGRLTLNWEKPVLVKELIYFGRTAFQLQECWKNCELFCDSEKQASCSVSFLRQHGPQRMTLPEARRVKKITLRFTSSHGGSNPGASEIMVFSESPSDGYLRKKSFSLPFGANTDKKVSEAVFNTFSEGKMGFDSLLMIQHRPLTPTHVYTYQVEGHRPGGGLYIYSLKTGSLKKLVDASEGLIIDCALSYDARQILFSWRRDLRTPFEIWKIRPDGTGLSCVIKGNSNNTNPCFLPDGGIAFISDRKPAFAYCWTSTSPILYRADKDGKNPIRLSANYLTDFTPSVMNDGRILFTRWEYVDRPAIPIQSLWAINPDGTMLSGVFGNRVLSPATFMNAQEIPGLNNRFLTVMTSHNGPCQGGIGLIDITKGGNAQEAIRNLTPDVPVAPVNVGDGNTIRGGYATPWPLDKSFYLVSHNGNVVLRDYKGTVHITFLYAQSPNLGFYYAQPLCAHPMPHSPRPYRVVEGAAPWAELFIYDVNIGLGKSVRPGEIKRIAVIQEMEKDIRSEVTQRQFGFQFPVVSCGATYAPKRVWGYARVEADGSAHFKVPASVPIYFLPLDAQGRAVQRMRTFTHLMPGERQSCIGCHADRNYISSADFPNGNRSIAISRPAEPLTPPEWGNKIGFSFPRIVQPVLDKNCVKCHDETSKLDLSGDRTDYFNVAYENLARRGTQAEHGWDARGGMSRFGRNKYTSWIPTYNGCESNILQITPKQWGSHASLLANLVIAGHPDSKGNKRIALTHSDQEKILLWIDLNVPYYGTSQSRLPHLRGCRRVYPANLDRVLAEVGKRRNIRLPRTFFVRLDHPEKNVFLAKPLEEGVFKSTEDPDYQKILGCFKGVRDLLKLRNDIDFRNVIGDLNASK